MRAPGEPVLADRRKPTGVARARIVEEHVMRDLETVFVNAHDIERVLGLLTSPTPPRCRRAALHDHHTSVSVAPGEHVERVADVGAMQMAAQNHLDPHIDKRLERTARTGHRTVPLVVGRRSEVMVRYDDAQIAGRRCRKGRSSKVDLALTNAAIDDGRMRLGGIESDKGRPCNAYHSVEFVADVLTVVAVWRDEPFKDAVQRHIVVSRHNHAWHGGQTLQKRCRISKLGHLGALGEIT